MTLNRLKAIIETNAASIHWHIYAALGGDGLITILTIMDPWPGSGRLAALLKFGNG